MQGGHGGPFAASARMTGGTIQSTRIATVLLGTVADSATGHALPPRRLAKRLHPARTLRKPGRTKQARPEQMQMNVDLTHSRTAAWPERGILWHVRANQHSGQCRGT